MQPQVSTMYKKKKRKTGWFLMLKQLCLDSPLGADEKSMGAGQPDLTEHTSSLAG